MGKPLREFYAAYLECSDDIRMGVQDMFMIIFDPDATNKERQDALIVMEDMMFGAELDKLEGEDEFALFG